MSEIRPSDEHLIQIAGLAKFYDTGPERIAVLREVDLQVRSGEMVGIVGPSGSGKSTLLFILGLFLLPSRGTYLFAGQDVLRLDRSAQSAFRRTRVGFVFQGADLLEHSTVYENLEYPLIYARVRRRDRKARVREALERVNMTHRIGHPANLLSGGERQRVAIARALVNSPQVILADEPTGQLDRDNSLGIMDHLAGIVAGGRTSVVLVTHDPAVAARCTKVCTLESGVLSCREGSGRGL
jgi:putative ABC transport system ATP-binding protein